MNPEIITIMGWPNFNNYDLDKYFKNKPFLDYFIVNQGETGFLNIIDKFSINELDRYSSNLGVI